MNFQQDGHMAMNNPRGRVNYEPNSWDGAMGGPRECHKTGFQSYPAHEEGDKLRIRAESFADHYSQARQFYISQTLSEQGHIADALIFELSKVETPSIRTRLVSHLPNIDSELAKKVAKGLGLKELPSAAKPAQAPRTDLKPSKALSIVLNAPENFKGRKIGILITDGVDEELLSALQSAAKEEGALVELIAPTVGGVQSSKGRLIPADQKLGGGPSVLYDAVAVLPSLATAQTLAKHPAARDFVTDAFTHLKFIAYNDAAKPLLTKAGLADDLDAGCFQLSDSAGATKFITLCRMLRLWDREKVVKPEFAAV
jgi:catalase